MAASFGILVKVRDKVARDMSLAAAKTEPSAQGRIPVLDIGAYLAGEAGAAAPLAHYRTMEAMTTRLVPLFALALDLPADYFAAAFAEPNSTIRLIHYPPHPSPEDNEFGFAPHTDNNFITFLAQSKLPGLEVRTAEGDWIRPPAVPGTFVVNTGAMLARYSNDRFRATPHRVINRNDHSRYACPFFLGPNP